MNSLTISEKKKLKSTAHHLKPVVRIGQKGLTDSLFSAVDNALMSHELIKIKFMEFKEDKRELSSDIAEKTSSEVIGIIGNVLILYRKRPDEK